MDFYSQNINLYQKQKLIELIDQMNANDKVTELIIEVNQKEWLNIDLLKKVDQNFRNLHSIFIYDDTGKVKKQIHDYLAEIVGKKLLLQFVLVFNGLLYNDKGGINLMKQYNDKVKKQDYL